MTAVDLSTDLQIIALDHVYGGPRRSLLGSKPNRLVLGIIGLHLLLTTFLASHLNLWFDEAYSLATTNNDLPTTLQWAINFEEQAPFYFILLWFTRHIHDSVFIARLPSILATAGTLWLSSRIASQLFPMVHRGWIVLALAFNPFLIAIALEARGYAWAVFLSTLLLWLFIKGYANSLLEPTPSSLVIRPFIPRQNHPWARWAYGIAGVIGLYSHYFLAFQIAAQGLVLLLIVLGSQERRRRAIASLGAYCFDSVIITIFTVPLFAIVSQQLTALANNSPVIHEPTGSAIAKAAIDKSLFRNLVFLLPSDPNGTTGLAWKLSRVLLGLWLLALAWGRRRHLRFNVTLVWLIHSLVMIQLLGALALVHSVEPRHSIVMLGLVYFSVLGLISLLPRSRRRLLLSLSLILLLCINGRSLWQVYSPMAKHGDYARVGDYLQQVVTPQQPVVVFNSEVAMTLAHYYPSSDNTKQALIPLPRSLFNGDNIPQYRLDNLILTSSEQIEQALLPAVPQNDQAPAQQERSEIIDGFTPDGQASELASSAQLTPRQIELEAKIRRVSLSPEAKAEIREALDLPSLAQQRPEQPQPESIEAFQDNLDSNHSSLGTGQPELPPSLWLVRDDYRLTSMNSFDESYRLLDNFMEQNYRLLTMRQFYGTQVQQWQRLSTEVTPIAES